jgi:hypothetical protein
MIEYNEEYFIVKEREIKGLTKDLDYKRYVKLCFIDFIDDGSIVQVDEYGVVIYLKLVLIPKDYLELSAYHIKMSQIYDQITECIEKVKIRFEPFEIEVSNTNISQNFVKIDTKMGRAEANKRKAEYERSMGNYWIPMRRIPQTG